MRVRREHHPATTALPLWPRAKCAPALPRGQRLRALRLRPLEPGPEVARRSEKARSDNTLRVPRIESTQVSRRDGSGRAPVMNCGPSAVRGRPRVRSRGCRPLTQPIRSSRRRDEEPDARGTAVFSPASKRYDTSTRLGPRRGLRAGDHDRVRRRVLHLVTDCRSDTPSDRTGDPVRRGGVPVRFDDSLWSPVRVLRRPLVASGLAVAAGPGHGKQSVYRLHRGHNDADVGDDSPFRPTPQDHRHVPSARRGATTVFLAAPA